MMHPIATFQQEMEIPGDAAAKSLICWGEFTTERWLLRVIVCGCALGLPISLLDIAATAAVFRHSKLFNSNNDDSGLIM